MPNPLRIGTLGTAGIVARALLRPGKDVPEVAVVSVGSRTLEKAQAYASTHGIPKACLYEDVIADPEIDVVYIALPNSMHAEWSIRALRAGKHVLCEKPMTSNTAEALEVARVVAQGTGVYMEAFHFPFHPFAKRVRDILDTRAIGAILSADAQFQIPSRAFQPGNIRFNFALAGGAMMDAGCYIVQALRGILGESRQVMEAVATPDQADPRVDTGMRAIVEFAGGSRATLHASFLAAEKAAVDITLRGEAGELTISSLYVPQWGGSLRLEAGRRVYTESADPTPSYVYQLRELVRCVRDGAPVLTSAANGVANMKLIDAIYSKAGLPLRGQA
jgi:predicted dehydrogenase